MSQTGQAPLGVKHDQGKDRWDLLPLDVLAEVVKVLTHGSRKYQDHNWKYVRPYRTRYFAAAMRHLEAWQRGELKDPETNLSHLAHCCCCLLFLLWADKTNLQENPDGSTTSPIEPMARAVALGIPDGADKALST